MKKRVLALLAIVVTLASCDATKQQVSGMYNLVNCKYSYQSISDLSISGINASDGLSLTSIAKVTSLNVDVKNPNTSSALMSGMDYIISIDDIEFTTGSVNQPLNIGAGQTQVLPIGIGLDLATLMKTNSQSTIMEIAKNFLGIGSQQSKVSVQLRPTFNIGQSKVPSPVYIPLNFSFGGKK